MVAVWLSDSSLVLIDEITARILVLGMVTFFGWANYLSM